MKKLEIINIAISLLVIILLGVAGLYLQKLVTLDSTKMTTLQSDEDCDLNRQQCQTMSGAKKVALVFSKPVKYLEKFDIKLMASGYADLEKVIVDFSMRDMQMGISRFELDKPSTADEWHGIAILPICVSGRKDWLVKVYLKTKEDNFVIKHKLVIN